MIHTVKGFSLVNEAEVFLEFSCFLYDPMNGVRRAEHVIDSHCPKVMNCQGIKMKNLLYDRVKHLGNKYLIYFLPR